jgi:uncharacterized protein YgiM (DUF1202 family)
MADIDTTGDKNFTFLAMKKNLLLVLGMLLTSSVLAVGDAIDTNAPAAKPAVKKKTAKAAAKPAPKKSPAADELRSIPLVAGPAVVIASNVNVRGRSGLIGEVITKISKGDAVTVIEEIILKKSAEFEPSAWAKIVFPASANVWVHSSYIDAATKTVKPKKLNLRGGPGENYSVIGTLEKGATVKEVSVKGDWMAIEAPAGAFAFVAAQYLKQEPAPVIAAIIPKPPEPAPTPTTVTEPAPVTTTTTEPPAVTPAPPTPAAAPVAVDSAPEEPLPPRVIQHEGIVKGTVSIQAPTKFALVNPDTGKTVNYLYTTSTNLDLQRYKGLHIVVTGEEGLDERWRNTPVITIQRIQVVD